MKNIKKLIALIIGVVMLVAVSSVLLGCPPKEPEDKKKFKVTIADYDTDRGSVTITKDGKAVTTDEFESGDKIKITVNPNKDYEIRAIYLNDSAFVNTAFIEAKSQYGWTYDLTVYSDRTIYVTFQDYGTWDGSQYKYDLKVNNYDNSMATVEILPDRARLLEGEEVSVTITLKSGFAIKSFKVNNEDHKSDVADGKTYKFNATSDINIEIILSLDFSSIGTATVDNFNAMIKITEFVLVDFWGTWCDPCVKYMGPSLDRLAPSGKLGDVKIVKVNIGPQNGTAPEYALAREAAKKLGKQLAFPFVVMYKNGNPVGSFAGANPNAEQQDNSVINFVKQYTK